MRGARTEATPFLEGAPLARLPVFTFINQSHAFCNPLRFPRSRGGGGEAPGAGANLSSLIGPSPGHG